MTMIKIIMDKGVSFVNGKFNTSKGFKNFFSGNNITILKYGSENEKKSYKFLFFDEKER